MNFRYLLFFLILSAAGFCAVTTCGTSYHDTVNVQVLDAKHRPVPGASAFIHYQYSGTSGPGGSTYYTAGPVLTNSNGIASFQLTNVEAVESRLDCGITVNATIGGAMSSVSIVAKAHPDPVDVQLNVYPVDLFVRESAGHPLGGSTVSIGNDSKDTDSNGFAYFYFPAGIYGYLVSYLDGKQAGSLTVSDDTQFSVVLQPHSIGVEVIDDQGKPLNATLIFANATVQLGTDGRYVNPKTFGKMIEFQAVYAGVTKQETMYPDVENDTRVVFDFTAPTILNISQSEAGGKVRLTTRVTDTNDYASGVNPVSFSVTYLAKPTVGTGQWSRAVTFVQGKNVFVADFPQFEPNTLVQFRVEVSDMDGNRAVREGQFLIPPPPPPPSNNTNGTGTTQPPPQGEGLPITYIAGGAILVVIIYYMFSRLKAGGG